MSMSSSRTWSASEICPPDRARALSMTPEVEQAVGSFSEWESLQEVIVGRIDRGVFPTWQESMRSTMPQESWRLFQQRGGCALPADELCAAERQLDQLAETLERKGVRVVRPDSIDHASRIATPAWECAGGSYAAMPRDLLMVVGDAIIEAPMSWRCRYHEVDAYRPLIKSYFERGARWLPAPRPQLTPELFGKGEVCEDEHRYAITEFEPVFDAADFLRFGRDLVVQKSHVTNEFGIRWLQQALGDDFRVHLVEVNDPHAMHIDATITALAPGKLLVNPERYVDNDLFRDWEVRKAPTPNLPSDWPMYFCSAWVSMNVLSLDERTVVVERQEEALIAGLKDWGFDCIPLDFRHVYSFGGGFHCATLDIRRNGHADSYLSV
jgi:glycine amidinotransferase